MSAGCRSNLQGSKVVPERSCRENVDLLLSVIANEISSPQRNRDIAELSMVVEEAVRAGEPIGENVVDELIALLRDRDEAVRAYSSMTLAEIGKPAQRAIPAMKAAVASEERAADSAQRRIGTGITSADLMRGALAHLETEQQDFDRTSQR